MDIYDEGVHENLPFVIGDRPIGRLVALLLRHMPADASLVLVSPIGADVKWFVQDITQNGKIRWWRRTYEIPQGQPWADLAQWLDQEGIARLAVWILVRAADGRLLAELEDGNGYIWLCNDLEPNVRASLLAELAAEYPAAYKPLQPASGELH